MRYYVYVLLDPTQENRVFYVGKGTGRRPGAHLVNRVGCDIDVILEVDSADAIDPDKAAYINHLKRNHGLEAKDIVRVVARDLDEPLAKTIESFLIKFHFGLEALTNEVNGGHAERFRRVGDWKDVHLTPGHSMDHYAYVLRDPDSGEVFYVGKGTGERALSHFKYAKKGLEDPELGDKNAKIRDLLARGFDEHRIARIVAHSLTTFEALAIESLCLKFVYGLGTTANLVRGHGHGRFRARDNWALQHGFDLPFVLHADDGREIRQVEREQMIAEGLDEQLYSVIEGLEDAGVTWGEPILRDANDLSVLAHVAGANGEAGAVLKLFIRSLRFQVEYRWTNRDERQWLVNQFQRLDYLCRRADDVYFPDSWVGRWRMTQNPTEMRRRVEIMLQWARATSRADLAERVGQQQCDELLLIAPNRPARM